MEDKMNDQLTPKERELIEIVRKNPELADCFLELGDIAKGGNATLKTGDEAEEATVEAIQKTGQSVLQIWVERRAKEAEGHYQEDKEHRPHEKKKSLDTHPSD